MNRLASTGISCSVSAARYPFWMYLMNRHADLRSYRDLVYTAMARARASGEPEFFENEGPAHARIVVDAMLESATTSVDVLAGIMRNDVWTLANLEAFLSRAPSGKLRVIVDDVAAISDECSVAAKLLSHARVEIRYLTDPAFDAHLCVVDGAHVRFEYDKCSREAYIAFGDAGDLGKRAVATFDALWADAAASSPQEEGRIAC